MGLVKELEAAGAHIIALKDMAGLLKPEAARVLIKTLREETSLPIHFHTHDTSGIAAASILASRRGAPRRAEPNRAAGHRHRRGPPPRATGAEKNVSKIEDFCKRFGCLIGTLRSREGFGVTESTFSVPVRVSRPGSISLIP